jgi:hypothetical protein
MRCRSTGWTTPAPLSTPGRRAWPVCETAGGCGAAPPPPGGDSSRRRSRIVTGCSPCRPRGRSRSAIHDLTPEAIRRSLRPDLMSVTHEHQTVGLAPRAEPAPPPSTACGGGHLPGGAVLGRTSSPSTGIGISSALLYVWALGGVGWANTYYAAAVKAGTVTARAISVAAGFGPGEARAPGAPGSERLPPPYRPRQPSSSAPAPSSRISFGPTGLSQRLSMPGPQDGGTREAARRAEDGGDHPRSRE